MELKQLTQYRHIVIQCHNVPDADAIASGFALQSYLRSAGASVALVYGGPAPITKPSLLLMQEMLGIELSHVSALPPETELLVTVDCQRGAGNVDPLPLPPGAQFVVLDHHRAEIEEGEHTLIRPHLASCATLVWDLLCEAQYQMEDRVLDALFYGLYTDTNGLAELRHPLDRDLADQPSDGGLIRRLKNSAITLEELGVISEALSNFELIGAIGLFTAKPCDTNLLGFTSDIAQQVARMDGCVVFCRQQNGLKLSIRSSAREIMASELAAFLCRDVGSGGGNLEKAGGFISFARIEQAAGSVAPEAFLRGRLQAYLENYNHVYAGETEIDFAAMPLYRKRPLPVGFVRSTEVFPAGTQVTIRTLEGDIDTVTAEDIYLMIGVQGETYPIRRERFEAGYTAGQAAYTREAEYQPVVLNRITGERREILPLARVCTPGEGKLVRALPLQQDTKVFTHWDRERYFYGGAGDYLAANEGAYEDCYVIRRDIFFESYEPV